MNTQPTPASQYQKGKINPGYTEARDSEWQWHQLGHTQVCTSPQTDNHASTSPLSLLQAGCPSCRPTNMLRKAALATSMNTPQWAKFTLRTIKVTVPCKPTNHGNQQCLHVQVGHGTASSCWGSDCDLWPGLACLQQAAICAIRLLVGHSMRVGEVYKIRNPDKAWADSFQLLSPNHQQQQTEISIYWIIAWSQ